MKEINISKLADHLQEEVIVKGWLYNSRSKGKIIFLLVRDGSGIVQCIATKDQLPEELFKKCEKIPQESSIVIKGVVYKDERAPGGVEILLKDLKVVSKSEPYPIQIQKDVPETGFLMDRRHLWLRSKKQHAIMKVRAELIRSIRKFFDERGFICIDAPILTPSACEGTTTLFEVNYFDQKAYLTQSGQLYAEAACMAFGKVYCFGPTFRAEKSKTRKHLTEFWMVEPEIAYLELDGLIDLAEEFVSEIVKDVLKSCEDELKILERDKSILEKVSPPFYRFSYNQALEILQKKGFDLQWGGDFGAPHEEALVDGLDKPLVVHRFPTICKAFYMKPDPEDPKVALCMDVLAPEGYGEIIGGSQRIENLELLLERIKEHNLPKEAFEWYVDLRRFGSVPHSGFGLGLERTVAWICGVDHVRECIPFPRTIYRIYP